MTTPQAQHFAPATPGHAAAPAVPVPVLPLEYAPPVTGSGGVWRRILRVCLPLGLLTCVVGVAVIGAWDVESVVVTGPVLFGIGLLTVLGGLFTRKAVAAVVGGGHCGICLLFLILVNLLNWSPRDAHFPFLVIGGVYTLAVAVPIVYAFTERQ